MTDRIDAYEDPVDALIGRSSLSSILPEYTHYGAAPVANDQFGLVLDVLSRGFCGDVEVAA